MGDGVAGGCPCEEAELSRCEELFVDLDRVCVVTILEAVDCDQRLRVPNPPLMLFDLLRAALGSLDETTPSLVIGTFSSFVLVLVRPNDADRRRVNGEINMESLELVLELHELLGA